MSSAAICLPARSVSLLTASLLALGVACSDASGRGGSEDTLDRSSTVSSDSAGATPSSPAPVDTQPAAVPSEPAPRDVHSFGATASALRGVGAEARPAATALAAQKSPIQALNQMVTAQALLVSLLLAPLSKESAEAPLARVDAAPTSAPAH